MVEIFLAHSSKDSSLAKSIRRLAQFWQVECWIAEEASIKPGIHISDKVREAIDSSDGVIALWTKRGVKSEFMNQEIGYAVRARKPILPLVEAEVKLEGFLYGMDAYPFDRNDFEKALNDLEKVLTSKNLIAYVKAKKARDTIFVLGIIFFFLLASRGEESG